MIRFDKLTKRFGQRTILDAVDLEIRPGEFVTITGASGSGKSTLVHLLIGADRPSDGGIFVDDLNIGNLTLEALQDYRRTIGVIFQDYKLLPKKSVFENVAYALEVTGRPDHEIVALVPKVLEMVGLHAHLDHFPHHLSGGEAQRVALARALVHEPRLLIADEPTGNLDPENAQKIMDILLRLNEDEATTIVLTTHNPELIKRARKRVVRIEDGELKEEIR